MAADFTGHYGVHWYSPQPCAGQVPTGFTSDIEHLQISNGLHNPPSMHQWRPVDEHLNRPSTDFDFSRSEWNAQLMPHNDLQSLAFENGYINPTVSNQLIENGAVQNTGAALQTQLQTVPLVNQEVERIYQSEPSISPLPLSERFPPVPFQDPPYTSLELHDQTMNFIPPLREQILPTNGEVLPEVGSVSTTCDNIFGSGNRAEDNPSFATSFLSNYETFRYLNTRAIAEPSQQQHISAHPNSALMNPLDLLNFNTHGVGGNLASNDNSFRPYILPPQPRGRPRGRPRTRSIVPIPPTSHRHHGHNIRCEWEGNCGTYLSVSTVVSHIRLHVASELVKALSGVTGTRFNVRYVLKPSTMEEFQFEDLTPKDRAMVLINHGRVWAKCMWGTSGCCFCRDSFSLGYLPAHVMSMHLGLGIGGC